MDFVLLIKILHCFATAAACAFSIAGDMHEVFEHGLNAGFHARASSAVGHFAADETEDFLQQLLGLPRTETSAVAATETLGEHSFEEPCAGPPMRVSGLLHRVQRAELSVDFGATKLFLELGVPLGFAENGVVTTLYAACSFAHAQAGGNKRTDFAASGVI